MFGKVICLQDLKNPIEISQSNFLNNVGRQGAILNFYLNFPALIKYCLFKNNVALTSGGAISITQLTGLLLNYVYFNFLFRR